MFQNTVSLFFYECKGMDFFAYFAFIIIFLPLHNGFIDLCEGMKRVRSIGPLLRADEPAPAITIEQLNN